MTTEYLTMSVRELDRAEFIRRIHERRLTQRRAAETLGLSLRQLQRLYRPYKAEGPAGLLSKKRGRTSNRKLSTGVRSTSQPSEKVGENFMSKRRRKSVPPHLFYAIFGGV